MEGIKQICGKELSRVFRDGKMLLSVFVLPVALMIVIMSITNSMASRAEKDVEEHESVVYVKNAPDGFIDLLKEADKECIVYTDENIGAVTGVESASGESASGTELAPSVKEAVIEGNVDLIIEFPAAFSLMVEEYEPGDTIPQIKTYYNPSEQYSSAAYEEISNGWLESYRQMLLSDRVENMEELTVFTVNSDNPDMVLQDEEKAGGKVMGMLLPYFVTILLFAGAMGIGADMVAGEKERGTLASLLVSPVKRSSIVLGKVFALMIISGVSAIVYVASLVVFMPQMMGSMSGESLGIDISLSAQQIIMLAVLLVAVAFLYSVIVVLVSVFAKSVKEATSYIMPAYMVVLVLGLTTMFTTEAPEDWLYAVPVYNVTLALQGILAHEVTMLQYALSVGVTLAVGGVLVVAVAKAFESEKVMAL